MYIIKSLVVQHTWIMVQMGTISSCLHASPPVPQILQTAAKSPGVVGMMSVSFQMLNFREP